MSQISAKIDSRDNDEDMGINYSIIKIITKK